MKRTILFLTLLLSSLGAFAYDFSAVSPSGHTLYYNIVNGEAQVTYQTGRYPYYSIQPTGALEIPSSVTYNGTTYSVTSIEAMSFRGCSGLTSVTIPNSVTNIGRSAFYDCSGLTSVTIGNSVTSIGERAFEGTAFYNNNSNRTNGVLYIGNYLIHANSDAIPSSYSIVDGTRVIANDAFLECSGLTSVTIPNSVTTIGNSAFYRCSGLTSVTIPNSVTSIGSYAFGYCSGLTGVTIPNSVTSIENWAFEYCSGLTSVTIPNSVTSIGYEAFYGCSGLTSVTIPNSVTYIGEAAFLVCSSLTSVTIGSSVTSIGGGAFSGCTQLATVYDYSNLPITRDSYEYGGVAQYATKVVKVLTDDRGDFNAPNDYTVDEVTYTRNYEQGNRSTLCLPFKPTAVSAQGLKFYKFTDFDGSTITYDEVAFEDLRANRPYMVEWPASAKSEFVFSATNATIPATPNSMDTTINGGSFIGTMARTCMDGTNYYGYKNGYFVQSRGGQAEDAHAHVNPFRAYFEITPSSPEQGFSMPTELSVRFNTAEDNVGIDNVEPQQSNIRYSNDVYDMMGRMVRKNAESLDGLRKGVYIWKGEKKIVF